MKKHWIEYTADPPKGPMTYWVHREVGSEPWYQATRFEPPRQAPVPGRGYPLFFVELDGVTFRFTSLEEIQVCIETLARKVLPRPRDLARERGLEGRWANSHWLSRLPGSAKSWRYRQKAIVYLERSAEEFRKALP